MSPFVSCSFTQRLTIFLDFQLLRHLNTHLDATSFEKSNLVLSLRCSVMAVKLKDVMNISAPTPSSFEANVPLKF